MVFRRGLSWMLLLLVCSLSSCTFTNPELIDIGRLHLTRFSKEGVEMTINAKVNNPNKYRVSVVGSKLDIYINGESMGRAELKNKVHFARKKTDTYEIVLVNKPQNFAKLGVVSLFSMLGNKQMKVTVKGQVKGRAGFVWKKFDVDFTENVSF